MQKMKGPLFEDLSLCLVADFICGVSLFMLI